MWYININERTAFLCKLQIWEYFVTEKCFYVFVLYILLLKRNKCIKKYFLSILNDLNLVHLKFYDVLDGSLQSERLKRPLQKSWQALEPLSTARNEVRPRGSPTSDVHGSPCEVWFGSATSSPDDKNSTNATSTTSTCPSSTTIYFWKRRQRFEQTIWNDSIWYW